MFMVLPFGPPSFAARLTSGGPRRCGSPSKWRVEVCNVWPWPWLYAAAYPSDSVDVCLTPLGAHFNRHRRQQRAGKRFSDMIGTRQHRAATSFAAGSNRRISNAFRLTSKNSQNFQDAKRAYERYLALARAQALSGDLIAAENYYQHAEHYFRSMSLTEAQTCKTYDRP